MIFLKIDIIGSIPCVSLAEPEAAAAAAAATEPDDDDMAAILAAAGVEEGATHSDEMIARMLQLQFDREHNSMLDREASKYNGTSKGERCHGRCVTVTLTEGSLYL